MSQSLIFGNVEPASQLKIMLLIVPGSWAGTVITNNLCWDLNTATIVRKANARMELIRRVAEFGTPIEDMKEIYILFVRSILEQSATVWHSSLTQEILRTLKEFRNLPQK